MLLYFFYNYQKFFTIVKSTPILERENTFAYRLLNENEKVEQYLKLKLNISLIALIKFSTIKKTIKNVI